MSIVSWIGVGVLILAALLVGLFVRRAIVVRTGGTIRLNLRLSTLVPGRGWSPGFARFAGDELRWYRMFSFAIRPRRVLDRGDLTIESRREPIGPEKFSLPPDWVVLRCTSHSAPVEIAMARTTVTGFLSWLESAPPGNYHSRLLAG